MKKLLFIIFIIFPLFLYGQTFKVHTLEEYAKTNNYKVKNKNYQFYNFKTEPFLNLNLKNGKFHRIYLSPRNYGRYDITKSYDINIIVKIKKS